MNNMIQNSRSAAPRFALYALMVMFAALILFPFLFMLMASLKGNQQIFEDMTSARAFLPVGDVSLDNYGAVLSGSGIGRYFLNSVIITIVTVGIGIIVNSLAAFSLARLDWKGKSWVLSILVVLIAIPFEAIVIPLLLVVANLPGFSFSSGGIQFESSWLDTLHVQIVPSLSNALSIYLFYQFFKAIPRDFDEAAYVDGATPLQVYRHVILPLSGPVIATVAIVQGLAIWNSYLWPVIAVPSEDARPLMVGMQQFFGRQTEWGQVMAYATLITIPVFAAFIIFQRWFVQSVMGSGVKG